MRPHRTATIALNERDLQVLRVSAAWLEDSLPALVEAISQELYAHPRARPYYRSIEQVRGQSHAWIRGVLGHDDVASLEATLHRVADIHRYLKLSPGLFVEICAVIGEHITAASEEMIASPEVRAAVVRTFTRVLFRQAAIYGDAPEPEPSAT